MLAGRDFLREVKADDTTAYLINETAMKDFGWTPEQAIGKKVQGRYDGKIIGVMKDFNYLSLHTKVQPLAIALTSYVGRISIRIRSEEHTSELQSRRDLVCRLLLEKKKNKKQNSHI